VTSQLDRPDIGSLANLFVGQSRGEQEDLAAVQALFTRAGIIPARVKRPSRIRKSISSGFSLSSSNSKNQMDGIRRREKSFAISSAKSNTHCGPGDPIPMKHSTFRCGSAGVR
jgi:hypothetical protein